MVKAEMAPLNIPIYFPYPILFGENTDVKTQDPCMLWKYSNKSGALPPTCDPGTARGISKIQVKDVRTSSKNALQLKLKMKNGDLDRIPVAPLTKIQADFVLGARVSVSEASPEAINGQCAEALITGSPINLKAPKPFCKQSFRNAVLDKVTCKGE